MGGGLEQSLSSPAPLFVGGQFFSPNPRVLIMVTLADLRHLITLHDNFLAIEFW